MGPLINDTEVLMSRCVAGVSVTTSSASAGVYRMATTD